MTHRKLALAAVSSVAAFMMGAAGVASLAAPRSATAQSGTGTISGRVVWGNACITFPMPAMPSQDGGVVPGLEARPLPPESGSGVAPEPAPAPDSLRPPFPFPRPRALPAGAVLVAAQGTALSVRTDENGRFSMPNVPAGQFLTIAAGPVAAASNAYALRPSVMVTAGQTVSLGTLTLTSIPGAPCGFGGFSTMEPSGAATTAPGMADEEP